MRIFAPNDVVAKSRFWYFLGLVLRLSFSTSAYNQVQFYYRQLNKVKKADGEIIGVNIVRAASSLLPEVRGWDVLIPLSFQGLLVTVKMIEHRKRLYPSNKRSATNFRPHRPHAHECLL